MTTLKRIMLYTILSLLLIPLASCTNIFTETKSNYTPPEWAIGNWGASDLGFVAYSISSTTFRQTASGGTVSWVRRTPNEGISSEVSEDQWILSFSFANPAYTKTFTIRKVEDDAYIMIDNATWSKVE